MYDNQLHYFTKMTDFLGRVLGPDYEVALYDIHNGDGPLIALSNNLSGKTLGMSLDDNLKKIIDSKIYENCDYVLHQFGIYENQKILCSSTMFLKDLKNKLTGIICINFDDSRYRELSQKVFNLCHPDSLINTNFCFDENKVPSKVSDSRDYRFRNVPDGSSYDIIWDTISEMNMDISAMTLENKVDCLKELDCKGVFLIKGAVKHTAEIFGCSTATIYRYLSSINKKNSQTS